MPKKFWHPGGKGGGGKFETVYTIPEVSKLIRDAEARTQTATLMEFVKDGYGLSRPNPVALPPMDPIDAPNWTMPLRIGVGIFAVVVLVILAVML